MSNKVIVLGAKGRFGRAAVSAFVDAGWHVTASDAGGERYCCCD